MFSRIKVAVLFVTCFLPSCIRVAIYRLLGFKVGRGSKLCILSVVVAPELSIGEHTKIWPLAVVTSSSALKIGSYSQVTPFAFIYGDRELVLKDGCYVGPRAVINTAERVTVGPNSGIGPNSTLYSHGVFLPYSKGFPRRFGPITIGESVWLGVGVSVLPGVTIGSNCIVAGGLVVAKSIPANSYVQGYSSRLKVTSIDLIKHAKHQDPEALVEDILKGLTNHCAEFSYKKVSPTNYHLSLDSVDTPLRVVNGKNGSTAPLEQAGARGILFLFNVSPSQGKLPANAAWFNVDDLTASHSKHKLARFLRNSLEKYFGMNFRYASSEARQQSDT